MSRGMVLVLSTMCLIVPSLAMEESSEQELPRNTSVPSLIQWWGYPVEEYFVTTPDGYILALYRIPHGKEDDKRKQQPPVILAHGMVSSSAFWTFGPPTNALAYLLADAGYDVWMLNTRGGTSSKNHTKLDPCGSCPEFWDFGIEESALLDFSTSVDFVLEKTGMDDLYFVGYSLGSTQYLILLSEMPQYNRKIKAGFLLAPTTHSTRLSFIHILHQMDHMAYLRDLVGLHEIAPFYTGPWRRVASTLCNSSSPYYSEICVQTLSKLFGIPRGQINTSLFPVYFSHLPGSTSLKLYLHFGQLVSGGRFAKFDHGRNLNRIKYGSPRAPDYPVEKITARTVLFGGKADMITTPEEMGKLAGMLPNARHVEVEDPDWNHFHFAFSTRVGELVFEVILEMMMAETERSNKCVP